MILSLTKSKFLSLKPIMTIYQATIPFMLVLLLAVLIITYWPGLSMFFISWGFRWKGLFPRIFTMAQANSIFFSF